MASEWDREMRETRAMIASYQAALDVIEDGLRNLDGPRGEVVRWVLDGMNGPGPYPTRPALTLVRGGEEEEDDA
jgi:hypothetical protein